MPTTTTNFSFNKPLVNDAIDEDLWGGQLNDNWDSIETATKQFIPIGVMFSFAGTTAPNAIWLLCGGAAVNRTTFVTLFTLISTRYGMGDGSTTFNLPDYRGRTEVGLANLGGASANRITDSNADSLNNTGMGAETDAGTIGTSGSTAITTAQMPSHRHSLNAQKFDSGTALAGTNFDDPTTISAGADSVAPLASVAVTSAGMNTAGSGSGHTHTGGTYTGATGSNVQASIAAGKIIRAL